MQGDFDDDNQEEYGFGAASGFNYGGGAAAPTPEPTFFSNKGLLEEEDDDYIRSPNFRAGGRGAGAHAAGMTGSDTNQTYQPKHLRREPPKKEDGMHKHETPTSSPKEKKKKKRDPSEKKKKKKRRAEDSEPLPETESPSPEPSAPPKEGVPAADGSATGNFDIPSEQGGAAGSTTSKPTNTMPQSGTPMAAPNMMPGAALGAMGGMPINGMPPSLGATNQFGMPTPAIPMRMPMGMPIAGAPMGSVPMGGMPGTQMPGQMPTTTLPIPTAHIPGMHGASPSFSRGVSSNQASAFSPSRSPKSPFRDAALGANPTRPMVVCYQRLLSLSDSQAETVIERYFRDRPEVRANVVGGGATASLRQWLDTELGQWGDRLLEETQKQFETGSEKLAEKAAEKLKENLDQSIRNAKIAETIAKAVNEKVEEGMRNLTMGMSSAAMGLQMQDGAMSRDAVGRSGLCAPGGGFPNAQFGGDNPYGPATGFAGSSPTRLMQSTGRFSNPESTNPMSARVGSTIPGSASELHNALNGLFGMGKIPGMGNKRNPMFDDLNFNGKVFSEQGQFGAECTSKSDYKPAASGAGSAGSGSNRDPHGSNRDPNVMSELFQERLKSMHQSNSPVDRTQSYVSSSKCGSHTGSKPMSSSTSENLGSSFIPGVPVGTGQQSSSSSTGRHASSGVHESIGAAYGSSAAGYGSSVAGDISGKVQAKPTRPSAGSNVIPSGPTIVLDPPGAAQEPKPEKSAGSNPTRPPAGSNVIPSGPTIVFGPAVPVGEPVTVPYDTETDGVRGVEKEGRHAAELTEYQSVASERPPELPGKIFSEKSAIASTLFDKPPIPTTPACRSSLIKPTNPFYF